MESVVGAAAVLALATVGAGWMLRRSGETHRSPMQEATAPPTIVRVDPTWLQLPGLQPGGTQRVVGESRCQEALARAAGRRTADGPARRIVTALLVRERGNPHDRNAVRVEVFGERVGYLPREDAPGFHAVIERLAAAGRQPTCRARILGGWDRGAGDRGSFGIELDVDPRRVPFDGSAAFLPDEDPVGVVGETHAQAELAERAGCTVATLHAVQRLPWSSRAEGPSIAVALDGTVIGALGRDQTARYLPLIRAVQRVGLPTTARCEVFERAGRYEVRLWITRPERIDRALGIGRLRAAG